FFRSNTDSNNKLSTAKDKLICTDIKIATTKMVAVRICTPLRMISAPSEDSKVSSSPCSRLLLMSLSLLPRAIALVVAAGVLTACTTSPEPVADETTAARSPAVGSSAAVSDGLAIDAVAVGDRAPPQPCPCVAAARVAEADVPRVADPAVDASWATPACLCSSYPEQQR